ncbi:MAG: radical SAM protein [Candidatus Shapirobacteria bacterium]
MTGQCNLNCSHCYAQEERKKANLSLRKVKNIIDQLVENGCLFLQLTGGECLVRKDFKEIYLYLKQVGIIPSVSTNATLLNNDLIRVFERYPPYQIIVSLYGSTGSVHDQITRVDGSFRKTLINVHKLKKASLFVWFSAIVMKENFTQVGAMEKLAERNKIPIIFYPFLIPRLNKDQSPLAHSLSDKRCVWILGVSKKNKSFRQTKLPKRTPEELLYPCNAGWHSFHINAEGKIYICKMERDLGYSLIKNSFKYSWPRLIKIRNLKLRLPKMCLDCQEKKECRVCPPLIRLYLSSKTGPVFCRRVKLKQRAVKSEMPSGF